MIDFLNYTKDTIAWIIFLINSFVIFFLTDRGRITNHPSIKWNARFVLLAVFFGEMCIFFRKFPWDFEYTGMRIFLSILFWYIFLFPQFFSVDNPKQEQIKNKDNKS